MPFILPYKHTRIATILPKLQLTIKVNPTPEEKVDIIFDKFVFDCEFFSNTSSNWKHVITNLQEIVKHKKCPFNDNAIEGISYFRMMMLHTVCRDCDDDMFEWLYKFAVAWLAREELPRFFGCVC